MAELHNSTDGRGSTHLAESHARLFYSPDEFLDVVRRRRWSLAVVWGGVLVISLVYCLVAPREYEGNSTVALRIQPGSSLSLGANEVMAPASILSTPLQLETIVHVFKSERLAWRVLSELKLYDSPMFTRGFASRFPGFDPLQPGPAAESYLLDRFSKKLRVRAMPRTLLIEISFRSKDPAQAAQVVNTLVRDYAAQEGQSRRDATAGDSEWLGGQLRSLTVDVERKEVRLADFEKKHQLLISQEGAPGNETTDSLHDPALQQVEELGRLVAAASGERIVREAIYRQAELGNPEQVLAADPQLQGEMGSAGATLIQQLRGRSSELAVELTQLKAEHGPNFPRVVELERATDDIKHQLATEDDNLLESFRRRWKSSVDREQLLQRQFDDRMAEGLRHNDAQLAYAAMHAEILSDRELCSKLQTRMREAGFEAGVRGSSITVVDPARVPFKPVSPNWPLSLAIAMLAGPFLATSWVLITPKKDLAATLVIAGLLGWGTPSFKAHAQAPTPNTSGLPSGVVRLPQDPPLAPNVNAKDAPPIWNSGEPRVLAGQESTPRFAGISLALPIAVGDFLEISEFHVPEFRSSVRVAVDGSVSLPMVGQVVVGGLTEVQAQRAVEKRLLDGGYLLHPQVSVLVTNAVGQDVSVMGEVARPGVYPYTAHHRLLDLIASASGLSANAGRLVMVTHRRSDRSSQGPILPQAVVLSSTVDPQLLTRSKKPGEKGTPANGADEDHNPELEPGDTIQVSRAGLVYVIGDVVRPGGFAVDPVQGLTVVQALSLAWGATPNASASKAILIRDQTGGRTLTTLNLRRMIRGQDPDEPVHDRDILFVPDSATKTLLNKTLESAIQSAIGVSIYAGLVYSQRF